MISYQAKELVLKLALLNFPFPKSKLEAYMMNKNLNPFSESWADAGGLSKLGSIVDEFIDIVS